jgi:hypothetical protein
MFKEKVIPSFPDFKAVPLTGLLSVNSFFSAGLSLRVRVSVLLLHEMHETKHIDSAVTSSICSFFFRLSGRNICRVNMNPLGDIAVHFLKKAIPQGNSPTIFQL